MLGFSEKKLKIKIFSLYDRCENNRILPRPEKTHFGVPAKNGHYKARFRPEERDAKRISKKSLILKNFQILGDDDIMQKIDFFEIFQTFYVEKYKRFFETVFYIFLFVFSATKMQKKFSIFEFPPMTQSARKMVTFCMFDAPIENTCEVAHRKKSFCPLYFDLF